MKPIAISIGAGLIVLILLVPLLPVSNEESAPVEQGAVSAPVDAADAPASASIPSEYEAPPLWNANNLVGTAWEADLADLPIVDDPDSNLRMRYEFFAPGRIRLTFERIESRGAEEDTFFRGFLPDTEGTFTVEGAQILVTARMVTGDSTDTIEIRGDRLYYHGGEMTPLHAQPQAAPGAGY